MLLCGCLWPGMQGGILGACRDTLFRFWRARLVERDGIGSVALRWCLILCLSLAVTYALPDRFLKLLRNVGADQVFLARPQCDLDRTKA